MYFILFVVYLHCKYFICDLVKDYHSLKMYLIIVIIEELVKKHSPLMNNFPSISFLVCDFFHIVVTMFILEFFNFGLLSQNTLWNLNSNWFGWFTSASKHLFRVCIPLKHMYLFTARSYLSKFLHSPNLFVISCNCSFLSYLQFMTASCSAFNDYSSICIFFPTTLDGNIIGIPHSCDPPRIL